jgi:hypothetical protein
MQHWFVYYKLDAPAIRDLEPRLRRMQHDAAAGIGVRTRLMRRVDSGDGPATLLEVYEGIARPDVFEAKLAAAVEGAALPASLVVQRRPERFEDL